MTFAFQARGDNANEEILKELYQSGFKNVFFGIEGQPLLGILRRSYRNFPTMKTLFLWHEYCRAFEEGSNEVLKCEPGGLISPFVYWTMHIRLGYPVVKLFQNPIIRINEMVRNSTSSLIYRLSQTYTIIGRRH